MSSASPEAASVPQERPSHEHLLLEVGGRWFGVPLPLVREVITARPFTRLPGAPESVCGLVNLRGRIVTVADLGRLLELPSSAGPGHRVVVLEHRGRRVGLAADDALRIARSAPGAEGEGERAFEVLDAEELLPRVFG